MLERAACERRVYRLATLLTGNPNAAAQVISSVVDAQPDLRKLDDAHLDRLTVLRSREITPGRIADPRLTGPAAEALASLTPQQREAWVFARVYALPERAMSKAMDCSVSAASRHLVFADDAIRVAHLAPDEIVAALRTWTMELDVPDFHRATQRRRRHAKRIRWVAALLVIAGLAAAAWWFIPLLLERI